MNRLDPVTFEVLRHRLWMINDEQGRVAAQVSGSPAVYEAKDFNSSLLTPDGDSLYVGVYTTRLSLCLNFAVRSVLEKFSGDIGIEDGDAFVTNDPWCGAAHMNDIVMVAPVFHGGRIVAWTGLAMHETDVGGPNPGSFTVGTKDVFGEPPLMPTVKMIERGRIRSDIEALVIRNSRTSAVNGLNVRARIAAINRTRERIDEMIGEYGVETFMALQEEIFELVRDSFARRLKAMPDGTWRAEGFLDHDGNTNVLYRIRLSMTKLGNRLTFDFTGTDRQAPGSVNCTRVGLESGVVSAVLPMLCYDMPWSPGALMPMIEFVSEEGTINNARHPAGVSMATVAATMAAQHVAAQTIAKMLACSPLASSEAQANWAPAWQGSTMAGQFADGRPFTAVLLDQSGGGGARAWRDGPDTGGLPGTPAMGIANVETYEKEYPILYVYRRQSCDTGGAGARRGGVGTEAMIVPHGNCGPIDLTVLTHGASQPEAQGLYGGYPSSVQVRLLARSAGIRGMFRSGTMPDGAADFVAENGAALEAKQRTLMHEDDALIIACAGGGGYGDPIKRDPEAVLRDVADGLCSIDIARKIYGAVLTGSRTGRLAVDPGATERRRAEIRAERLSGADVPASPETVDGGEAAGAVGMAFDVVDTGNGRHFACAECGRGVSGLSRDPKTGTVERRVRIDTASPWNRYGLTDQVEIREYACPACAHLFAVDVRLRDEPPLLDTSLAPDAPAR